MLNTIEERGAFFTDRDLRKNPVVICGAGKRGRMLRFLLSGMNVPIQAFCDSHASGELDGTPIIKITDLRNDHEYDFIISPESKTIQNEIITNIKVHKLYGNIYLNGSYLYLKEQQKEPIVSFSEHYEDIILYHALKKYNNIFYVDIGANHPLFNSDTKLFYDSGSCGINIEPLYNIYEKLQNCRNKDININIAVSDTTGIKLFYSNNGFQSTLEKQFLVDTVKTEPGIIYTQTNICTDSLENIAKKYVAKNRDVHFCKIDVEGHEKNVLLKNDWEYFRPWIFCLESTIPGGTPYDRVDSQWSYLLVDHGYSLALQDGNNSYYTLSDRQDLRENLIPAWYLIQMYDIYKIKKIHDTAPTVEDIFYHPHGC